MPGFQMLQVNNCRAIIINIDRVDGCILQRGICRLMDWLVG
jgi:hypothetical protein